LFCCVIEMVSCAFNDREKMLEQNLKYYKNKTWRQKYWPIVLWVKHSTVHS